MLYLYIINLLYSGSRKCVCCLKDFAGVVLWCRTVFLKLFASDFPKIKCHSVIVLVLVLVNKSCRVQVTTL